MIMETEKLHVVMFPWFAFGHISPFVQLSNKLSAHDVRISFFSAHGNIPRISSSLDTSPAHVQIIPLQIPHVEGLPIGLQSTADMTPSMSELLKTALDQMQPQIKSLLADLKPHFVLHDFAQHWLPAIADELGIKSIFFSVFSAVALALCTVPARLKPTGESPSVEDMKEPPPGFPSEFSKSLTTYQAHDALYVFQRFHRNPSVYTRFVSCMKSSTAIVLKTCCEMEGPYVDYLKAQYEKPVLLLGPVVPNPPAAALESKWAKWLDMFPKKSVIFCSFGSETFLSREQIKELVLGLEATGLPFLVVLNFVDNNCEKTLTSALPERFEERVKGKGMVHTGWVQQQQILAHESVGCFVFHAGFSSIIEGLINDCQLVLLPQKADQFLNAKLMSEDMEAGTEVTTNDEDGSFSKSDLCAAIKTVMVDVDTEPGKTIRTNNKKWKEFMVNQEIHEGFITDFVKQMKDIVTKV